MIDFHIHSEFSDGDQTIKEIISSAVRRKLTAIAITDHSDSNGKFMFIGNTKPPRPLSEYISEVRFYSKNAPLKLYLGIEISSYPETEKATFNPQFKLLDFILIESFPTRSPVLNETESLKFAIQLKEKFDIPVGIAHPTIINIENSFNVFEENGIFIELNSDKLISKPSEKEKIFNRLAELLKNSEIKISIGSDAHNIFTIGGVKEIWNFILKNKFQERLIFPP